jgi:hypothetical protein
LGLPDAGCEFGTCGGIPGENFGQVGALAIPGTVLCQLAEPCGAAEDIGWLGVLLAGGTAAALGVERHTVVTQQPNLASWVAMAGSREANLLNWIARAMCVDRNALGALIHEAKKGRQKGKGSDLTVEDIKKLARELPKVAGCTSTME